jgi:biopolymer transport protein ExbB
MHWTFLMRCVAVLLMLGVSAAASAQEQGAPSDSGSAGPSAVSPAKTAEQMTMKQMLQQGGFILWTIILLSVVALGMAIYLFLTLTPAREAPESFLRRAVAQIRAGDLRGAYQMCEGRDELLANVLRSGLRMSGHERYVVQEAMESEGERGATALWQRISYLNNIGVIAPMLGLLGTVWGMIQAFGGIAYDDSQVKGIMIAAGVAQAMITTVAGLSLAIPAMLVYFYLRGRVVKIIAEVEAQSSELVELLTRNEG